MHSKDSKHQQSRSSALERARKFFGYPPNLVVEMSHSIATVEGYMGLLSSLRHNGTLTQTEQEIVMLAISAWNGCEYSMAAHRMAAKRAGVAQSELDCLSQLKIPTDRRLQALTTATWALLDRKGWLLRADLAVFEDLGIEKAQLYEIIALISAELVASYVDHIEKTRLDAAILSQRVRALPKSDS